MGYRNANSVLPQHLLDAIQQYIDGEYLYIPRKDEHRKQWGECTRSRQRLLERNREIAAKRRAGYPVSTLAEEYYLSDKAVYKILSVMNTD